MKIKIRINLVGEIDINNANFYEAKEELSEYTNVVNPDFFDALDSIFDYNYEIMNKSANARFEEIEE